MSHRQKISVLDIPIMGSDSWGDPQLLELCGSDCEGAFSVPTMLPMVLPALPKISSINTMQHMAIYQAMWQLNLGFNDDRDTGH